MKVFGMKVNLVVVAVALLVVLLAVNSTCSCCKPMSIEGFVDASGVEASAGFSLYEGFEDASGNEKDCSGAECFTLLGSEIAYDMGSDVEQSMVFNADKFMSTHKSVDRDSYSSTYVNPEETMAYFTKTEFKPSCCAQSALSSSSGCACMNNKQVNYLNNRGNKNTDLF